MAASPTPARFPGASDRAIAWPVDGLAPSPEGSSPGSSPERVEFPLDGIFQAIDRGLPFDCCLYYQILPLSLQADALHLGLVRPDDRAALNSARSRLGSGQRAIRYRIEATTCERVLSAYCHRRAASPADLGPPPTPVPPESAAPAPPAVARSPETLPAAADRADRDPLWQRLHAFLNNPSLEKVSRDSVANNPEPGSDRTSVSRESISRGNVSRGNVSRGNNNRQKNLKESQPGEILREDSREDLHGDLHGDSPAIEKPANLDFNNGCPGSGTNISSNSCPEDFPVENPIEESVDEVPISEEENFEELISEESISEAPFSEESLARFHLAEELLLGDILPAAHATPAIQILETSTPEAIAPAPGEPTARTARARGAAEAEVSEREESSPSSQQPNPLASGRSAVEPASREAPDSGSSDSAARPSATGPSGSESSDSESSDSESSDLRSSSDSRALDAESSDSRSPDRESSAKEPSIAMRVLENGSSPKLAASELETSELETSELEALELEAANSGNPDRMPSDRLPDSSSASPEETAPPDNSGQSPAAIDSSLAHLSPRALLQALLERVLSQGIGRLYWERPAIVSPQESPCRILWSQDGVLQSAIAGLPEATFQGTITELKLMAGIPPLRIQRSHQAEIERHYHGELLLLRLQVMPSARGEEATLQVLRGAALRFYRQRQLAKLGEETVDLARQLQQKLSDLRDRAAGVPGFHLADLDSVQQLDALLQHLTRQLHED